MGSIVGEREFPIPGRQTRAVEHIKTTDTPGILQSAVEGLDLSDLDLAPLLFVLDPGEYTNDTINTTVADLSNFDPGLATQAAEKNELASVKYEFGKAVKTDETVGWYGNLSQQLMDWGRLPLDEVRRIAGIHAAEKWFAEKLVTIGQASADIPAAYDDFDTSGTLMQPTHLAVRPGVLPGLAEQLAFLRGITGLTVLTAPFPQSTKAVLFNPHAVFSRMSSIHLMEKRRADELGLEASVAVMVSIAPRDTNAIRVIP